MKKVELSEEFMLKVYEHSSEEIKKEIETTLPDLFCQSLKEGTWNKWAGMLVYVERVIGSTSPTIIGCGFDKDGSWRDIGNTWGLHRNDVIRLATKKEVEEALIKEAKRRGFKKGVKFYSPINNKNYIAEFNPSASLDVFFSSLSCIKDESRYNMSLCDYGGVIYSKGKWAEIIPEVQEFTMDEIAEKLGIPVEQLKIKK